MNSTVPKIVSWKDRHPNEIVMDEEEFVKELIDEKFGPFAGISFDMFDPNGIEGVFSTGLAGLRASSIAGEGGSNNMVKMGKDSYSAPGSIVFYKMAQLGNDSQFDIVEAIHTWNYEYSRDEELVTVSLPPDTVLKKIELEPGFVYGFVLNFCAFSISGTNAGADKLEAAEYSGSESARMKFSFQTESGLSTNDVVFGKDLQMKGNMPDISQVDFIQSLCYMFGMFPIINPIPKKDDETGKRTVEFVSIDTLFKNKVSRYVYGKKFNDWTDRLITDPNDIEISFSKDGYYQRNYLRYTEDDTVTGDYDGYFDIPDKSLDKEGDLTELPFAASEILHILLKALNPV